MTDVEAEDCAFAVDRREADRLLAAREVIDGRGESGAVLVHDFSARPFVDQVAKAEVADPWPVLGGDVPYIVCDGTENLFRTRRRECGGPAGPEAIEQSGGDQYGDNRRQGDRLRRPGLDGCRKSGGPTELIGKCLRRLGPARGGLFEATHDHGLDLGRDCHRAVATGKGRRSRVHVLFFEPLAVAVERGVTGQELVENDANGVQVAPRLHRAAVHLFGTGVARGADRDAAAVRRVGSPPVDGEGLGQAEVENLEVLAPLPTAVQKHQVRRFEVAVNDGRVLPVGGLQHLAELVEDPRSPGERHRLAFLQHLVERLPFDIFHNDIRKRAVGQLGIVNHHRVGVIEPGHHLRFVVEPKGGSVVPGEPAEDDLEGAKRVEFQVANEPDLAHAPSAQKSLDLVATGDDLPS